MDNPRFTFPLLIEADTRGGVAWEALKAAAVCLLFALAVVGVVIYRAAILGLCAMLFWVAEVLWDLRLRSPSVRLVDRAATLRRRVA